MVPRRPGAKPRADRACQSRFQALLSTRLSKAAGEQVGEALDSVDGSAVAGGSGSDQAGDFGLAACGCAGGGAFGVCVCFVATAR
jgi:hypothetical protein